jgi:hypothetical protein
VLTLGLTAVTSEALVQWAIGAKDSWSLSAQLKANGLNLVNWLKGEHKTIFSEEKKFIMQYTELELIAARLEECISKDRSKQAAASRARRRARAQGQATLEDSTPAKANKAEGQSAPAAPAGPSMALRQLNTILNA